MATTTFSLLALASSLFGSFSGAAPVAEHIDGYVLRAEVEADRMQFENCMERLNSGETSLQHCVPQWATPVVEVPETTTTTTVPASPTTAPPAPATTVAPAPTTTTVPPAPADPVEACIEDFQGCLTSAIHNYIDASWIIPHYNPPFPVDTGVSDGGWAGPCMGPVCTSFSTARFLKWKVYELSFADFTTFASNWCPVNPGQEGNDVFKASCGSGHPAGGRIEVKWSYPRLTVTWSIGVASAPGYDSWSDWYRGTHS